MTPAPETLTLDWQAPWPDLYAELIALVAGCPAGGPWRLEGVLDEPDAGFRLLAAVHDFQPGLSYATAADVERPWTLLWPAEPSARRRPFFSGREALAAARFSPELAGLMVPVSAELAPALVGMRLTPTDYLDAAHWGRLAEARTRAAERRVLDGKLADLFQQNKPEQAGRLAAMMPRDGEKT